MKLVNGLWMPDGDTFFQSQGDYELQDYISLRKYLNRNRLAIDIGAHVGFWSRRLIQDFDIVHAFEPEHEHVMCLKKNINNHKLVVHNLALSDHEGTVKFSKYIENSGMSRVSPDGDPIYCTTLDSFNLVNVDLIKIDVEHHELEVLKGAKETILKYKPVLFIEILHGTDAAIRQEIFNFISPMRYYMSEVISENYIFTAVE